MNSPNLNDYSTLVHNFINIELQAYIKRIERDSTLEKQ